MSPDIFPVGILDRWKKVSNVRIPDALLKNWLLNTGSLTERLQSQCRHFNLEVLGQALAIPTQITTDEYRQLYGNQYLEQSPTQIREVILYGDKVPWVFARTLIPKQFIDDEMQDLATLGTQPLGKILFNDQRFKRQEFQLICCEPVQPLFEVFDISVARLWGRRSTFRFKQHHIMVCEIFLPGSPAYRDMEYTFV